VGEGLAQRRDRGYEHEEASKAVGTFVGIFLFLENIIITYQIVMP
jgi:hypothetical protein